MTAQETLSTWPSRTNTQKGLREGGERCCREARSPTPQDPGRPSRPPAPTTHPGTQPRSSSGWPCTACLPQNCPAPELRVGRPPGRRGAQSSKGTGIRARSPWESSHSPKGARALRAPHREPRLPQVSNCPSLPWSFSCPWSCACVTCVLT